MLTQRDPCQAATAAPSGIGRAGLYWLASLIALAAGAWWACPQGHCAPPTFDRLGLELAHGLRGAGLDPWMRGVTWLGSLWLLLPLAGWIAWRLTALRRRVEAIFLALALLGASALSHLAKLWVARPRPEFFMAVVHLPWDWSYPSAHAMQAAAVGLALVLVARRLARAWAVLLALTVLLVGLSRVYLQVHYPSDVLAGMLAAALWVFGLHALMVPRRGARDEGSPPGGEA